MHICQTCYAVDDIECLLLIDLDSFARLHGHKMHENKIAVGYNALFSLLLSETCRLCSDRSIHMPSALHSKLSIFKTLLNPIISYSATISYFNRYWIFFVLLRSTRVFVLFANISFTNKIHRTNLPFKRWKMFSTQIQKTKYICKNKKRLKN